MMNKLRNSLKKKQQENLRICCFTNLTITEINKFTEHTKIYNLDTCNALFLIFKKIFSNQYF